MKVLLVSRFPNDPNKPRGGVEAVTVVLANALAELQKIDVNVVTFNKSLKDEIVEEINDVTVHRLNKSRLPQLLDFAYGSARAKLVHKIKEVSPDILHWHETSGIAGISVNVPEVFTIHGFTSENINADNLRMKGLRSKMWNLFEQRAFSNYKDIISITPYVKNKLLSLTAGNIYEIDNPLDERFFRCVREKCDPQRVLCVGWISPRKNTLTSVRAFHESLKRGTKGKLIIAGASSDDNYLEKVKSEVAALGIEKQVEFLGYVDRDCLMKELQRASVMLLPSLQENAPMAIAEAMAARVPVIVSNLCGMPYMVDEGKTGFLVEPMDVETIAERLTAILEDEDFREKIGRKAQVVANDRFHPKSVAAKTVKVYREVIERYRKNCKGQIQTSSEY